MKSAAASLRHKEISKMAIIQVPYNPKLFKAVINGIPVLDPADTDTALMCEYNDDRVSIQKGMYGDAAFDINVATDGTFTIELKRKSPTNAQLGVLMNGQIQFRVQFVDKNTNVQAANCLACMVQTNPGISGGISSGNRTWVIGGTNIEMSHDGHRLANPLG
jgi:hypothetical protein